MIFSGVNLYIRYEYVSRPLSVMAMSVLTLYGVSCQEYLVTLYGCLALWCSYGYTRNQQRSKINNKSIVTNGVINSIADTKDDRKLLLDKTSIVTSRL